MFLELGEIQVWYFGGTADFKGGGEFFHQGLPMPGCPQLLLLNALGASAWWHSNAIILSPFVSRRNPERETPPLQIFSHYKIHFTEKRHSKCLMLALHFSAFKGWVCSPASPIRDHRGFWLSITWLTGCNILIAAQVVPSLASGRLYPLAAESLDLALMVFDSFLATWDVPMSQPHQAGMAWNRHFSKQPWLLWRMEFRSHSLVSSPVPALWLCG